MPLHVERDCRPRSANGRQLRVQLGGMVGRPVVAVGAQMDRHLRGATVVFCVCAALLSSTPMTVGGGASGNPCSNMGTLSTVADVAAAGPVPVQMLPG